MHNPKGLKSIFDEVFRAFKHGGVKENTFWAKPIGQIDAHYCGVDHNGNPCLLIKTVDSKVKSPIKLESLEILFSSHCEVSFAGSSRLITLTSVVCKSIDKSVHSYFIHVCEILLDVVGEKPGIDDVYTAVNQLVSLFRKLSSPTGNSVTGLTGELLFISRAKSVRDAVEMWRCYENDRYDFASEDFRIEVKSSKGRSREHSFSLEQCTPPTGATGLLVSIFIESSGGGKTLASLIGDIETRLEGDSRLVLKMQEVIAETLGASLPHALLTRFDEKLAISSLAYYHLVDVPCPLVIPEGVSQVRFRSDLSGCNQLEVKDLYNKYPKLTPLLPA